MYANSGNQLLFAITLIRDLPEINWFVATNFCDQNVDYLENDMPKTFVDWFMARNIHDDKALSNLVKISRMRIKVGLQFTVCRPA